MNELRDPDKVRKQMTAIKMSADLGKRLQAEHPENLPESAASLLRRPIL